MCLNEIMIDLETLSTKNNAVILTIGAVKFRRDMLTKTAIPSGIDKKNIFYKRVDIKSCLEKGLVIDKDTEEWWKTQPQKAQFEAVYNSENRLSIVDALKELSKFIGMDTKQIWSQGSFDTNILTEAYTRCGLEIPFKFYNVRDCRTVFDILNVDLKKIRDANSSLDQHHALEDCFIQLIGLSKCYE